VISSTPPKERAPQLSQDVIVDAALRVAKRVGFDRLTMRLLADELGVTAMAAYHHVASKEQLLELVADAIILDREPIDLDAPWEEQLRQHAFALFECLASYPGLGAFLLERPLTPAVRRGYSQSVDIFRRAGLPERDAQLAYATYHTYMFGLVGMETRFRPLKRRARAGGDAAILVDATTTELIDFGVEMLVEGTRSRLPTRR
jgi:TetR/AcrR family transcriptional regulator, tetracycline repressor protein